MTVEPLRLTFRRQVREQSLQVAHRLTVDKGWPQVRMSEVAARAGVSRPTLYKEFGDKQGLGEALILRETDRFLTGIAAALEQHPDDIGAGILSGVEYMLEEADASPLLRGILTSARAGDNEALPLLTTRSAPILSAATGTLVAWFHAHFPGLDDEDVADSADALARLAVSHLVLPAEDAAATARRLARIALRCLRLDLP